MQNFKLTFTPPNSEISKTIIVENMIDYIEAWDYATIYHGCVQWGTCEPVKFDELKKEWGSLHEIFS